MNDDDDSDDNSEGLMEGRGQAGFPRLGRGRNPAHPTATEEKHQR